MRRGREPGTYHPARRPIPVPIGRGPSANWAPSRTGTPARTGAAKPGGRPRRSRPRLGGQGAAVLRVPGAATDGAAAPSPGDPAPPASGAGPRTPEPEPRPAPSAPMLGSRPCRGTVAPRPLHPASARDPHAGPSARPLRGPRPSPPAPRSRAAFGSPSALEPRPGPGRRSHPDLQSAPGPALGARARGRRSGPRSAPRPQNPRSTSVQTPPASDEATQASMKASPLAPSSTVGRARAPSSGSRPSLAAQIASAASE